MVLSKAAEVENTHRLLRSFILTFFFMMKSYVLKVKKCECKMLITKEEQSKKNSDSKKKSTFNLQLYRQSEEECDQTSSRHRDGTFKNIIYYYSIYY